MKVYGPYLATSGKTAGRRYVNIVNDDGSKTTMLWSRWQMQQALGRELATDEHVDHIDEDKTNDDLSNLQILSGPENIKKNHASRGGPEMITFICPICNLPATKLARKVRSNRKQGKAGPFCGHKCARTAQGLLLQW